MSFRFLLTLLFPVLLSACAGDGLYVQGYGSNYGYAGYPGYVGYSDYYPYGYGYYGGGFYGGGYYRHSYHHGNGGGNYYQGSAARGRSYFL
jgi:hypothetical protein